MRFHQPPRSSQRKRCQHCPLLWRYPSAYPATSHWFFIGSPFWRQQHPRLSILTLYCSKHFASWSWHSEIRQSIHCSGLGTTVSPFGLARADGLASSFNSSDRPTLHHSLCHCGVQLGLPTVWGACSFAPYFDPNCVLGGLLASFFFYFTSRAKVYYCILASLDQALLCHIHPLYFSNGRPVQHFSEKRLLKSIASSWACSSYFRLHFDSLFFVSKSDQKALIDPDPFRVGQRRSYLKFRQHLWPLAPS